MNKVNTERLIKAILAEPRQFAMNSWYRRREPANDYYRNRDIPWTIPGCGTAACIGGHCVALMHSDKTLNDLRRLYYNYGASTGDTDDLFRNGIIPLAMEFLGITEEQARVLFFIVNWPVMYYTAYQEATDNGDAVARAKVAVDRIRYMMETGK